MTTLSPTRTAVLLVDVINHFEFPGGDALLEHAELIVKPLLDLRRRAHAAGAPVIYANDNYGDWHSSSQRIIERCRKRGSRGADFTRALTPLARDYFVLKPANSAFYSTTLETLLRTLRVKAIVVAGLTAENCVLFTAHDAYLRGFKLYVPADCVASEDEAYARRALEQMQHTLKASIAPSTSLAFSRPARAKRRAARAGQRP